MRGNGAGGLPPQPRLVPDVGRKHQLLFDFLPKAWLMFHAVLVDAHCCSAVGGRATFGPVRLFRERLLRTITIDHGSVTDYQDGQLAQPAQLATLAMRL